MGFDLYGLDPMVNPDGPPKPDKVTFGEDGFHEYAEMQHEFEQANVGVYFRNNVWYWRPLWSLVEDLCGSKLFPHLIQITPLGIS